ncbi:MAG: hypothetical protein D6778_06265, partial [Nitrospirae bacterium]
DFLKVHPEAVLDEIELPFSLNLVHGVTEWRGYRFSEVIKRCIRVYPHMVNSWGFFVARIKRPD